LRIKNTGLQALTAHFMAGRLAKDKKDQMSNWDAVNLRPSQIKYAATYAWVSREVHIQAQQQQALFGKKSTRGAIAAA
jgi:ribonuclease D